MTALVSSLPPDSHSESTISSHFDKIPLSALRQKGRLVLSQLLNPVKILLSEEGYRRDWRGIAHLAGLERQYGAVITAQVDPMEKILQLWSSSANESANFENLMKFLGIIDRWDVADDIFECLVSDTEHYNDIKFKSRQQAIAAIEDKPIEIKPDSNILTRDDVIRSQQGLPPQQYDAFVLFADEDIDFAAELVERLEEETHNFNFKLCVKDRDLIGGISFEHEAIMCLIRERCNRLIVILSKAFLESSANSFFVYFAQALQIEQQRRKIIPCLYENCPLPPSLNYYFLLKYHQSGRLFNFWDKLSHSIRQTDAVPIMTSRAINPPSLTITEIDSVPQPLALSEPVPIKAIRKKNKNSETKSLSPISIPKLQTKIHPATENERIRSAHSMVHLNTTSTEPLSNGTSCSSNFCGSLNSLPEASKVKTKKSKSKSFLEFFDKLTSKKKNRTQMLSS